MLLFSTQLNNFGSYASQCIYLATLAITDAKALLSLNMLDFWQ